MARAIPIGTRGDAEEVVEAAQTLVAQHPSLPPVYSTPDMVRLMEWACFNALQPFCDAGEMTVGTAIQVEHRAASGIGMRIHATAELEQFDGRFYTMRVSAHDGVREIGRGTIGRAVIHIPTFLQRLSPNPGPASDQRPLASGTVPAALGRPTSLLSPVAIIGAGLIGRAWALVFARAGCRVRVWDVDPAAVAAALAFVPAAAADLHKAGLVGEEPAAIASRVSAAATLAEAVRDAEYVQENVAERVEVKQRVFAELDRAAPASCILASSTSTIPASVFSEQLPGRHRCLVAHPVNPPHVVPIVELSPAPWTSDDVVARARACHEALGQVPIVVRREVQGFILNRLQAALLMEAWRLVGEGYVSVADLDKTIKDGLGLRWAFMGPFETIDLNAPGGVRDYAARYGRVLYEQTANVRHVPWTEELIARVEAERRAILPQGEHAAREAWRDRRLEALVAHKRAMAESDR